jgi:hypothetical protein
MVTTMASSSVSTSSGVVRRAGVIVKRLVGGRKLAVF